MRARRRKTVLLAVLAETLGAPLSGFSQAAAGIGGGSG